MPLMILLFAFVGVCATLATWPSPRHDSRNTGQSDVDLAFSDQTSLVPVATFAPSAGSFVQCSGPIVGEDGIWFVSGVGGIVVHKFSIFSPSLLLCSYNVVDRYALGVRLTSLSLAGDTVFFGAEAEFYALFRENCTVRWSAYLTPDQIANNSCHAAVPGGTSVFIAGERALHAFGANTGHLLWSAPVSSSSPPAFCRGSVFLTDSSGGVIMFDAVNGTSTTLSSWPGRSTVVSADCATVYVLSDDVLMAIDTKSGRDLNADGHIVVAENSGTVALVSIGNETTIISAPRVAGPSPCVVHASPASPKGQRWNVTLAKGDAGEKIFGPIVSADGSAILCFDYVVYVLSESDQNSFPLNARCGELALFEKTKFMGSQKKLLVGAQLLVFGVGKSATKVTKTDLSEMTTTPSKTETTSSLISAAKTDAIPEPTATTSLTPATTMTVQSPSSSSTAVGIVAGVGAALAALALLLLLLLGLCKRQKRRGSAAMSVETETLDNAADIAVTSAAADNIQVALDGGYMAEGDAIFAPSSSAAADNVQIDDAVFVPPSSEPLLSESAYVTEDDAVFSEPAASPSNARRTEPWVIRAADLHLGAAVGEGGFGIVRSGKWRGRTVAVKQIKRKAFNNEKALAEFEAEVKRMSALQPHENVVQLYGVADLADGDIAAVMEWCASGALVTLLYGPNKQPNLPNEQLRHHASARQRHRAPRHRGAQRLARRHARDHRQGERFRHVAQLGRRR